MCKLDNFHGPLALVGDYALVAGFVYLCLAVSWWFYPVALILIGSTQRVFATFLHESSHKTLASTPFVNFVLGTVFSGYLVLHLYGPYRNSHIGFHHRYLGEPGKDPDYEFHLHCGLYDPQTSNARFFFRNILSTVFGLRSFAYLTYIIRDRSFFKADEMAVSTPLSVATERVLLFGEWAIIVGICSTLGWLPYLALFWFVPMFTTYMTAGWISELAEHYPLPESETARILLTRNRHGRWLERFLIGRHNDNLHLVHHLNTGIPFWNIKRAHQLLMTYDAYARWDNVWAGALTRSRAEGGRETLVSYAGSYRLWRRDGGEPAAANHTFAELMILARNEGAGSI